MCMPAPRLLHFRSEGTECIAVSLNVLCMCDFPSGGRFGPDCLLSLWHTNAPEHHWESLFSEVCKGVWPELGRERGPERQPKHPSRTLSPLSERGMGGKRHRRVWQSPASTESSRTNPSVRQPLELVDPIVIDPGAQDSDNGSNVLTDTKAPIKIHRGRT